MLHALIMAGGSGTRFWPASRQASPKQLLALAGEKTMLQETVARLGDLVPAERTLIITNQKLVAPIRQQLPHLAAESVVGEPAKRDTAPCVGLAAVLMTRLDPEATMAVMPADHVIAPAETFQAAIREAAELVEADPQRLVTFGIRPTYPAESFGYIERGAPLAGANRFPAYRVERFREKPNAEKAAEFLAAGNFSWNSGIFVWKARTVLEQLARYEPDMHERLHRIAAAAGGERFHDVLSEEFTAIRGKSIDFAVMEHAREVVVIDAPFQWDDVGSWQALPRLRGTDAEGNTLIGRHLGIDTRGSIVRTSDDHLVVTLGLEDVIVVHTPDATLVARKQDEEQVRKVVEQLQARGWHEHL